MKYLLGRGEAAGRAEQLEPVVVIVPPARGWLAKKGKINNAVLQEKDGGRSPWCERFFMTCYLMSYRFFVLCKVGLSMAYLWACWDFVRINLALGDHLQDLLPPLASETLVNDTALNSALVNTLLLLSSLAMVWIYFVLAPVAVGLFIWGRHRWVQVGVGAWVWLSMIGLTARASILMSTADFWLNWCFICYVVAGFVTPRRRWDKSQPPTSRELWRANPIVASEYALLVVILQFTVYFYAGINKLLDGWVPWIYGTAIQNLSYDLSMRDYARGLPVPFWISAIFCYVTLFQRLVVPFGFFIMRYRGWAVLILGAMHAGYEMLMQVAIFPLVGLSGLLLIIPPRELALPLCSRPTLKQDKRLRHVLKSLPGPAPSFTQRAAFLVVAAILLVEPIANAALTPDLPYWNIKLGTLLHWTMFSDGGAHSRVRLRVGVMVRDPKTGMQRYDEVTDLPLRYLPDTWRTRFYQQTLLFKALAAQNATGEEIRRSDYLAGYVRSAVKLYEGQGGPHVEAVNLELAPYDTCPFPIVQAK